MPGNGKFKNRLRACGTVDVPLEEVSGICSHRSKNGRMHLIAVGDRLAKIAWFSPPRSGRGQIDWHTRNIAGLSGSKLPKHDPQIEAVCADGLGRIALLQETPPRVELIDPKASKVIASIDLAVEERGEIARAWSDPEGSCGEGMVLLPEGHLLVAKEKKPAALKKCSASLSEKWRFAPKKRRYSDSSLIRPIADSRSFRPCGRCDRISTCCPLRSFALTEMLAGSGMAKRLFITNYLHRGASPEFTATPTIRRRVAPRSLRLLQRRAWLCVTAASLPGEKQSRTVAPTHRTRRCRRG
jgi:hypothetical protein